MFQLTERAWVDKTTMKYKLREKAVVGSVLWGSKQGGGILWFEKKHLVIEFDNNEVRSKETDLRMFEKYEWM